MLSVMASRKQELEKELRELVQEFFATNDSTPESVSVEMKLFKPEQIGSIHILVKDKPTTAP